VRRVPLLVPASRVVDRSALFRRQKSESAPAVAEPVDATKPGGKGRPTPSRREAEAAARARAKAAMDPRASKKQQRQYRAEKSRTIRQAIKDGDERYLPKRDQGPVKRFVRDYVDTRLSMAEFALPLLFASLLLTSANATVLGSAIMQGTLIIVVVDSLLLRWRMRRELKRRFPEDSLKGTTTYAYMRTLQMRFLRLPKPQRKLGEPLPEHYR
jgi:hypothetical protein